MQLCSRENGNRRQARSSAATSKLEVLEARRLLSGSALEVRELSGSLAGGGAVVLEVPLGGESPPAASTSGSGGATVEDGLEGDVRGGGGSPVLAKEDGVYYMFTGGPGVQMRRSFDTVRWDKIGQAFDGLPQWVQNSDIDPAGYWAPDIVRFNGKWHLYYTVSTLGSNRSAIGVATSVTLDPGSPDYQWQDQGMVIQSFRDDNWNAIDQNIILDEAGTPWMVYGSYWSGIKMRKLDASTGKLASDDTTTYNLAQRSILFDGTRAVEAPFIVRHDGWYYLFVSFDRQPSEYNIRVGRSRDVTGPYVDRDGTPLMQGGGTIVYKEFDYVVSDPPAGTDDPGYYINAPGHNGVLMNDNGTDWLVHHYKDTRYGPDGGSLPDDEGGARVQMLHELIWGPDGWPVVGEPHNREALTPVDQPVTAGVWRHSAGFREPVEHRLLSNGHINTPDSAATWTQEGNILRLRWPSQNAPGGAWIDEVTVADNGQWYVGRNQNGTVVRGVRSRQDTVAPRVVTGDFLYDSAQSIRLSFSEDVSRDLNPAALRLENLTTGHVIDAGAAAFTLSHSGQLAQWTFGGDALLPDGNYRATLPAGGAADAEGNVTTSDHSLAFFVLAGDTNRDRKVDFTDFLTVRSHFGTSSGALFSDGDFTYDGRVDFADFLILRSRFGVNLPLPSGSGSLFAEGSVGEGEEADEVLA